MRSIFRRFRMEQINKKGIKKYLLYAIGEIILVVIGILIALQINNWNNQKNDKAELKSILHLVKLDLEDDIAEVDRTIEVQKQKIGTIDSLIERKIDFENFKKCENCPYFLAGFRSISVSDKGANRLDDKNIAGGENTDSLYYNITSFYQEVKEANGILDELLKEQFISNITTVQNTKTWFGDWLKRNRTEEIDQYFFSDPMYLNKLTLYGIVLKTNYLEYLKHYKSEAENLLEQINQKLE